MQFLVLIVLVAFLFLSACAEQTDPWAAFEQGDYAASYRLWKPLAKQGDLEALNYLGIQYYLGLGVNRDFGHAFKLFEQAGKRGNADALVNLGIMYEYGYGVTLNYSAAFTWFYAAYRLGNAHAEQRMNDLSASKMSNIQIGIATEHAREFLNNGVGVTKLVN
ncbi:MAG: tetratricopeptide repeat protein [Gammaproteobacteria bacterium]